MKKVLIIMWLLILPVYAEVDLETDYTSEDVIETLYELEAQYPEIINIKELGHSEDGKALVVVRLGQDIAAVEDDSTYVEKMHFFIEGGIHSRENAATPVLLKTIEMYAMDYYDNDVLPGINIADILDRNILHIMPLTNPDGYDFANFGLDYLSEEGKNKLLSYDNQNFPRYKSNVNGVDLNRNFPGSYYDIESKSWQDLWYKKENKVKADQPGPAYYFGEDSASENETKVLMSYMLKYDFRNYISYHSRGEVIYWYKWMLSDAHNKETRDLAHFVHRNIDYEMVKTYESESSSGYLTDYTAMETLKPSITIETVSSDYELPVDNHVIEAVYEQVKYVPIIAVLQGQIKGYYDYKLYVDGVYVRDFQEKVYADAIAARDNGVVIKFPGQPIYNLEEVMPLTRMEAVYLIMSYFDSVEVGIAFDDTNDSVILQARTLNIISGYNNMFKPNDYISFYEICVLLRNAFYDDDIKQTSPYQVVGWAQESFDILFNEKIIDYTDVTRGIITKQDLLNYLEKIHGGPYD